MSAANRKLRRSRGAAASTDDGLWSGLELYNVQGDASGARDALAQQPSPANDYNCMILETLSMPAKMVELMNKHDISVNAANESLSPRKRRRNELILAYNRALALLTQGDCREPAKICAEKLKDSLEGKMTKPPEELAMVESRMAFLLLECILAASVGRTIGLSGDILGVKIPSAYQIIEWLELFDAEKDPQFKFLLNLYRSRLDLSDLDESGKHIDSKIRSARKELKQAMDVFQHRLRPSFGAETGSVVSSANSEENNSQEQAPQQQQQQPPTSLVLQKHNQSALSLKANSEQLKGNTKKSLILCGEAQGATDSDPTYEVVHTNNLAVVYATMGKRHLALHALAKGLQARKDQARFCDDGTARPDQTLLLLHNSAICALQARSYVSAYECMAVCISQSPIFAGRPRCWLRLAEACVGIFAELKSQPSSAPFAAVKVDGESKGVVIDSAMFADHPEIRNEPVVETLGSQEDLEQVKRNPLVRARATLQYALQYENDLGEEATTAARLTLAYVHLAFRDYSDALSMAKLVLYNHALPTQVDDIRRRISARRMATARMYAAEASCALGQTTEAMKFLVGDGQDDAFDRLASDLSGVTIETAAANGKGKRRLARAQTVVRSSASAVTAAMGNLTAAKQLAMQAQAMEDAFASNRERSSARRALIYTLLRGGHQGPALSLLRSLR